MSNIPRIFIPLDSQSAPSWQTAIAYAEQIARTVGSTPGTIILLTHTKSQLKDTALAAHLGANAKVLASGSDVRLSTGPTLTARTLQTLRSPPRDSVILAFFGEDRMLETVDGLRNLAGVVVVPDHVSDAAAWKERWNPTVHGQPTPAAPAVLLPDTRIEKAMLGLNGWINLSHAILNPRDKGHVDEVLRILKAKGHVLDPKALRSWAIRNGWQPGAAGELEKLAAKIAALKAKPSLAKMHNPNGRYDSWV